MADANPYRYVGKYEVLYDKDINLYLMGWRDYDPSTGRFIVPDEYEGEEDEPTSLNRYLYADADPVNNIDPDGHAPKWLQKGWKSTKKIAKKGLKFGVLDDINTLRSPNSKWYHKAGAAASLASNFVPGAGVAKFGVKAVAKYGVKNIQKGAKGLKAKKFVATSVKQNRTVKAKKQAVKAKTKNNTKGSNQLQK
nr:RHS repeat-associated core domain-containing protein [Sutcliffiella horikoshii]